MTATPTEFGNSLRAAFPGEIGEGDGWLEVSRQDVRVRFDYLLLAPLRIGILALPRMEVIVSIEAGQPDAVSELLERVDRFTQRGGG